MPKKMATRHTTAADSSAAVDALLAALVHPMKEEIVAIRQAILGADPSISEGVKWNSLSFRTHEYFATVNLREKQGIGVILHLGAKVRELGPDGIKVADPEGLLKWLADDRATVTFSGLAEFEARRPAFVALIQAWITRV
jgi:hypothetical protein